MNTEKSNQANDLKKDDHLTEQAADNVKRVKIGKKVEVIVYEKEVHNSPDTNELAEAELRRGSKAKNKKQEVTKKPSITGKKKIMSPESYSEEESYSDEYDEEDFTESELDPIEIVSSESSLDVQDFEFI
jgi:hypothetical protein